MNDAAVTAKTFRRQGAEFMGLSALTVTPFSATRSMRPIVPHVVPTLVSPQAEGQPIHPQHRGHDRNGERKPEGDECQKGIDHDREISVPIAVTHVRRGLLVPGQFISQRRSRHQDPGQRLNSRHRVVDDDRRSGMVGQEVFAEQRRWKRHEHHRQQQEAVRVEERGR